MVNHLYFSLWPFLDAINQVVQLTQNEEWPFVRWEELPHSLFLNIFVPLMRYHTASPTLQCVATVLVILSLCTFHRLSESISGDLVRQLQSLLHLDLVPIPVATLGCRGQDLLQSGIEPFNLPIGLRIERCGVCFVDPEQRAHFLEHLRLEVPALVAVHCLRGSIATHPL